MGLGMGNSTSIRGIFRTWEVKWWNALYGAAHRAPADFRKYMGWKLVLFVNFFSLKFSRTGKSWDDVAFYVSQLQLLHLNDCPRKISQRDNDCASKRLVPAMADPVSLIFSCQCSRFWMIFSRFWIIFTSSAAAAIRSPSRCWCDSRSQRTILGFLSYAWRPRWKAFLWKGSLLQVANTMAGKESTCNFDSRHLPCSLQDIPRFVGPIAVSSRCV